MWKVTHLSHSITQDTQQFFHHSCRCKWTSYHLLFYSVSVSLGRSSLSVFLQISSIELVLVLRGRRGQWQGGRGCRARADEALLAVLQRNVGSLRLRRDVCCERPRGSRDRVVGSHKGAWKRMTALQFQFSLGSSMSCSLLCKCGTAAAAKQDGNRSQTGTCANYYPNFSPRRNGTALKMTFKLSLQSNLSHQSAVNSPCEEQISRHPCPGVR